MGSVFGVDPCCVSSLFGERACPGEVGKTPASVPARFRVLEESILVGLS